MAGAPPFGRRLLAALGGLLLAAAAAAQAPAARGGDAAVYASGFGVTLPEARRRLALQRPIGELEVKLREVGGAIFAGLWIEHSPRFVVQVRFTDVALGETLLRRVAAGVDAEFEIGAAAASLRQLEARQRVALAAARAAGAAADVDLDLRASAVLVEASARARPSAGGPEELRPVESAAGSPGPLLGGRPLSNCTTAFAARSASGEDGVLTAGHCPEFQVYRDYDEQLFFAGGEFGGSRDVAFFARPAAPEPGSGEGPAPGLFDSGLGLRPLSGTRPRDFQPAGSLVCRFGMTTPHRCGLIVSKHFCPAYVAGCTPTFLRVRAFDGQPLATFGDSGGPWFVDGEAHGVHSGHFESSPEAVYTAIDYAAVFATVD